MTQYHATFRFYGPLNDLLPAEKRQARFTVAFTNAPGLRDVIESLGVPHTEVEGILLNGAWADLSHRLRPGDDVAVYPVFHTLRPSPPEPARPHAFICDVHLGRLCRVLRLLGFDTLYRNDLADREIVAIAAAERRTVLTRDRGLLKHAAITRGCCVRSTRHLDQAAEVIERFSLRDTCRPFSRCVACNGEIGVVPKAKIMDRLEEKTLLHYETFFRCSSCGKIYWEGSHHPRLTLMVQELLSRD